MKSSYQILSERRLNIVRFSGSLSVHDVTRVTQELWSDSRFDPEFDGIVDMENITTRTKVDDLKVLLDFLETHRKSSGRWVAIFRDQKIAALAMIFKAALNSSFTLEIVSSWEAACKFLHIELSEDLLRS